MPERDPKLPPESKPTYSEQEKRQLLQYLAAYFDVSGSVTIERGKRSFVLRLDLERVDPTVVTLMRETFPMYEGTRTIPSQKVTHRWYAKGPRAMNAFEELSPFLKMKAGHYKLVREFDATKGIRTREEGLGFKELMKKLNKNPEAQLGIPLETPYLAGLFDAHGSITIWGRKRQDLTIGIAIKNREFLEFIKREVGMGSVVPMRRDEVIRGYVLNIEANKAKEFLLRILPFLRSKRELAQLAIEFQDIRMPPLTRVGLTDRRTREGRILARIQELLERKDVG